MRILRGLSSKLLACGCVAGVYETYDGLVVTIVDSPAPACAHQHTDGAIVPAGESESRPAAVRSTSSTRR